MVNQLHFTKISARQKFAFYWIVKVLITLMDKGTKSLFISPSTSRFATLIRDGSLRARPFSKGETGKGI
jgi:hypothetical protein